MSSSRLKQQFIRLWQSCQGQSQETTLGELADALHCSRRHMRNLLNRMQEAGWLTWQAEAGRSKRSVLTFCYTGLTLQQQRAEDLLEQDRIDQLVQLVGDKDQVRQMISAHLGRSFRQENIFCASSTIALCSICCLDRPCVGQKPISLVRFLAV